LKLRVVPVLNSAPRHKDVWGSEGIAPLLLISALGGSEWSASRFTPGETASDTHCIKGWVGPRAGLDAMEKRKNVPLPGIKLQHSSL
jgi:hypothetical protein